MRRNGHRLPKEELPPDRPMIDGRRDQVLPYEPPAPRGARILWHQRTPRERLILEYVKAILDHMPNDQAWVLERYFLEEMQQPDIAKELGISQQAVSLRIRTALGTFARKMVEVGGFPKVAAEAVLRSWQREWRDLPPADLLDELMGADYEPPRREAHRG